MQASKLAEIILYQLECLYTLQELEHYITEGNTNATKIIEKIYDNRPVPYMQLAPLLKRPTCLNILYVPIAFLCRLDIASLINLDLIFDEKHNIVCYENNIECELDTKEILTVIRNSLSHLADFASNLNIEANLTFDGEATIFYTQNKSRKVVIQSEIGFIEFVKSIISCSKKSARSLLNLETY
jgi:hypothetical protein